MKETIGGIILDFEYYCGDDLYCDGPIEDELLEIAKMQLDDYNSVIASRNSWEITYHFSAIRQNIIEWLPMDMNQSVLEVGAGCGAITGCLAKKAKKVTCIELSRKRSYINAYRNAKYDNIEIKVGNFQDIEPGLSQKYDVITLIGVLEYAALYIQSETPFEEMLRRVKRHLAPHGRIIIAIENRLGLKYWAGCAEDHSGRYFEGIEGYTMTESAKTFSKKELQKIFKNVGGLREEFYYPYPDYKFPLSIYSDSYLPKRGELKNNLCNMDRQRVVLFDETKAFDTLIDEKQFPEFSNSFLVILERN